MFDKEMKIPAKRMVWWGLVSILSAAVPYVALLVGNPNDLEGKFASYEFFPHSKSDVLEFQNGLVTMKTCCGNSYAGDYETRDGEWVWHHQAVMRRYPPQFRYKEPVKIHVEPHLFSLTLRVRGWADNEIATQSLYECPAMNPIVEQAVGGNGGHAS